MMNTSTAPHEDEQRRRTMLVWTLPIAFLPVLSSAVAAVLLHSLLGPPPAQPSLPVPSRTGALVALVVLVVLATAFILLVRLGKPTTSVVLFISLWTLLTTFVGLLPGVVTFAPALLIVPICAAGLLIDGVASIGLALLATLLIVATAALEMSGVARTPALPPEIARYQPILATSAWLAVVWGIAVLTWLLAGNLQRALKRSSAQAEELRLLSAQLEARVIDQTAELAKRAERAEQLYAANVALGDRLRESAMLEERARLAREIHDTLAQGLTGVVVQLSAARDAASEAPEQVDQHLDLAQGMAREALAEARRSVWNLRAAALDGGDLADALQRIASRPLRSGAQIQFVQQGESWLPAPAVESALLRVAQEALANVAQHAQATQVQIVLTYAHDAVALRVSDNGIGFDEVQVAAQWHVPGPRSGFGLRGMRERIVALGGGFEISGSDGTTVYVVVPRVALPVALADVVVGGWGRNA